MVRQGPRQPRLAASSSSLPTLASTGSVARWCPARARPSTQNPVSVDLGFAQAGRQQQQLVCVAHLGIHRQLRQVVPCSAQIPALCGYERDLLHTIVA